MIYKYFLLILSFQSLNRVFCQENFLFFLLSILFLISLKNFLTQGHEHLLLLMFFPKSFRVLHLIILEFSYTAKWECKIIQLSWKTIPYNIKRKTNVKPNKPLSGCFLYTNLHSHKKPVHKCL